MTVEFRVLGEVQAVVDGQVADLGPSRQRCVLVALLVDVNRVVSVDQLMDRVWGDRPPHSGSNALHSYLSRLRKALGITIARQPGGYVLRADPEAVDLHRYRGLTERARRSDDATAVVLLDQALALWRGAALSGVETPWADKIRTALHRDRVEAVLDRNELCFRGGRHAELVPELLALTAEEPLDERLAGQLMRALYLDGRSAHALEHYERVRRRLSEELGVDPSPALQQVHQQVLTEVPALTPANTRPVHALPHDVVDFTGRDEEVARLLDTVGDTSGATTVIVAIDGMAGVGKTALAVHAAHRLAERYPDVQLFIDLHAHSADRQPTDTAAALGTLLRSVGVGSDRIPAGLDERSGLWRAELAGRKALVVLDNVASAAQVRPLLPGGPGCLALITSRRRLTDLESARTLSLDVLPHPQAVALFTRILGAEREPEAVGEVAVLCGHLPLAIRIAAARLRSRPVWTVAHLAGRLRAGLSELATGDRSVESALQLSYRQLTEAQQRLFRLLGLHPGADFDGYSVAALTAAGVTETERTLEDLVDLHLLHQPEPSRYRMHDLLRTFAADLAATTDSEDCRRDARTRLHDRYLATAARAVEIVAPGDDHVHLPDLPGPVLSGYGEALAWLERERENLVATATSGANPGELSTTLLRYLDLRGYHDDALALHGHAAAIARRGGDVEAECRALGNLGTAHERLGRFEDAEKHHRNALDLATAAGVLPLEGRTHNNLANVYLAVADHPNALVHYRQALDIAVRTGNRIGECRSANNLGIVHERLGQYDEAFVQHTNALAVAGQIDDVAGRGYALHSLGFVHRRLGRTDSALDHFEQALEIAADTGNRSLEGYTRLGLGLLLADLGRFAESDENLHNALSVALDTGNRGLQTEALNGLGESARRRDDPARALVHHRDALALAEEIGDRYQKACAHDGLAHAHHALGCRAEARKHWNSALALHVQTGVPEAAAVRVRLSVVDEGP